MAYRKTEKVLAHLEARRAGIIAAAIDVISRSGMEGLTTDAIAERGAFSVGLIFKYFPDMVELRATLVQQLLSKDTAAIRQAGSIEGGIKYLFERFASNYRLMSAVGQVPAYREGMKREFARLIRATEPAGNPSLLASVVYGSIFEAAGMGARVEPALTSALAKALGMPSHARTKVVA